MPAIELSNTDNFSHTDIYAVWATMVHPDDEAKRFGFWCSFAIQLLQKIYDEYSEVTIPNKMLKAQLEYGGPAAAGDSLRRVWGRGGTAGAYLAYYLSIAHHYPKHTSSNRVKSIVEKHTKRPTENGGLEHMSRRYIEQAIKEFASTMPLWAAAYICVNHFGDGFDKIPYDDEKAVSICDGNRIGNFLSLANEIHRLANHYDFGGACKAWAQADVWCARDKRVPPASAKPAEPAPDMLNELPGKPVK